MLNETSSINAECVNAANKVSNAIDIFVKEQDFKDFPVEGIPGLTAPQAFFYFRPTDIGITEGIISKQVKKINVKAVLLTNEVYRQYFRVFYNRAFYNLVDNEVFIVTVYEKGENNTPLKKFYEISDFLSHEFVHALQKHYNSLKAGKFYEKAWQGYANNRNSDFGTLCYSLYYFCDAEINANANALYHNLKDYNVNSVEEATKTLQYKNFLNVRNSLNVALLKLKTNEILQERVEKYFKCKYTSVLKFIVNGLKICTTKFGKVISYYLANKDNEETVLKETTLGLDYLNAKEEERKAIFENF